MDVMVVGSGGREHALIRALTNSPQVEKIYALPGNGGIAELAECVSISATDFEAIETFALDQGIGFVVVAPDDPLVMGLVDRLEAAGIPCFGPNQKAALIEGSKSFAKDLMHRHNIPTAASRVFSDESAALEYLEGRERFPVVIKADGLALGKGVVIANDRAEATEAVHSMMSGGKFGASGRTVVVEEFLEGPEVSLLAFTDGTTVVPMVSAMDHKRAFDADAGPNTGGMGVVAPNPYYTDAIAAKVQKTILEPTVRAMASEGRPFRGCLYFGLMLTDAGPQVIEYNCRFGDPEAQAVLPLLKSDLFEVMVACRQGTLDQTPVEFSAETCCCVVMASGGYPLDYQVGQAITIGALPENVTLYHAGTRLGPGGLETSGGRVLGVSATAPTLAEAVATAYRGVDQIDFSESHYRSDIGRSALGALSE